MSLAYYAGLLEHGARIEAFRRGIRAAVREGDRVLDLGCGLGTFAFFAVRAGAGRVWAVDRGPVLHVARSVARANGLEERIEFVRGRVPGVELPGSFDVVVFEDFPRRLLDDRTHRMLRRVEVDLLAPGARAVPASARLRLAPVGASRSGPRTSASDAPGGRYEIDWSPLRPYLANEPRSVRLGDEALLAEPAAGPDLSLLPPPEAGELEVRGRWTLADGAAVGGLLLWFDLETAPEDRISNAPGPEAGPWGQLLLPLDPPLRVAAGGTLEARVRPETFSDGAPGWLTWRAACGDRRAGGHEFAAYPAALGDLYPEEERPAAERAAPAGGRSSPGRPASGGRSAREGRVRRADAVDAESGPVEDS